MSQAHMCLMACVHVRPALGGHKHALAADGPPRGCCMVVLHTILLYFLACCSSRVPTKGPFFPAKAGITHETAKCNRLSCG